MPGRIDNGTLKKALSSSIQTTVTFHFAMDMETHNYTDILLLVCRCVHRPLHFKVVFQEFLRLLIQFIILRILSVAMYMAFKSKVTLSKHVNV